MVERDGILKDFPVFEPGWVWLVGAGPGDPGLLTLHALNALAQADVVIYDALVDEAVLRHARAGATIEYAGKRGGKPSPKQRDISLKLVELARAGKRVCRLKGGDPFVFGRGGEEALALVAAKIPFRVVPGISAAIGGLAYAGIPMTHRDVNHSVTFLTGHDQSGLTPSSIDWRGVARGARVIVMYMAREASRADRGVADLAPVARLASPSPSSRSATTEKQRVLETTLGQAAAERRGERARTAGDRRDRRSGADARGPGLAWCARGKSARRRSAWLAGQDWRERDCMNGLIVAAAASHSGKTTVSIGLIAALRARGLRVGAAKCGPDYIDPKFLEAASGSPAINLDPWAMPPETIERRLALQGEGADIVIVEGVMGLFDGGKEGIGSTASLARLTGLPVLLVVGGHGVAQTAAAVAEGCARLAEGFSVVGAIANQIASERHADLVREGFRRTSVPLLGLVRRDPSISLPSRHLGLVQAEEHEDLAKKIARAGALVAEGCDLDAIVKAATIPPPPCGEGLGEGSLSGRGNEAAFDLDSPKPALGATPPPARGRGTRAASASASRWRRTWRLRLPIRTSSWTGASRARRFRSSRRLPMKARQQAPTPCFFPAAIRSCTPAVSPPRRTSVQV